VVGGFLVARWCGARDTEDVDVLIDRVVAGTLHFTRADNDPAIERAVELPATPQAPFAVEFHPHDTRSPAKLGCDTDPRPLGCTSHASRSNHRDSEAGI
jgi:hypothetical protein